MNRYEVEILCAAIAELAETNDEPVRCQMPQAHRGPHQNDSVPETTNWHWDEVTGVLSSVPPAPEREQG